MHGIFMETMPFDKHCDRNKLNYRSTCELALIISLSLALAVSLIYRKSDSRIRHEELNVQDYIVLMVDDIPVTTQGGMPRRPDLPELPIPSEDIFLPRDETIDTTHLDLADNFSLLDIDMDDLFVDEDAVEVGAVLPASMVGGYVELEILVNYNGWVDSVKVLQNTTGNRAFENLARKSAYRTRYIDERAERESNRWIRRYFNFKKR